MTPAPLTSAIISVAPPVLVGLSALVYNARQAKGNANLTRAMGLFDLHDRITERGPIVDPETSKNAAQAHADLLMHLEREARANSYLFLESAARLRRPGDVIFAIVGTLYGGGLTTASIVSLAHIGDLSTGTEQGALLSAIVLALVGLPTLAFGLAHFRKRFASRRIRRHIGLIDPITFEGIEFHVRRFGRSLRRAGKST
jgi:hypothetical protein